MVREQNYDDSQKRAAAAVVALVIVCLAQLDVEETAVFAL